MKIALSTESALDIQEDLIKKYDVSIIPFTILMGEKEFKDGEIKGEDIFAFTEETGKLAKTCAVNENEYYDYFEKKLSEGYDTMFHFCLGSKISSSCSNAEHAAKRLEKDGKGKVYVIDSMNLSSGIALEIIYCRKLIDAGFEPDEIERKVKERIPFVQTSFGIESVKYLYMGGRCSAVALLGANVLKIRPQIIVKDGKMVAGKKYLGKMSKWAITYTKDTLAQFSNPDLEEAFITYSSADEEVVDEIEKILKERGFRNIHRTRANGTVCCHCGPRTLGILYINDGEHKI